MTTTKPFIIPFVLVMLSFGFEAIFISLGLRDIEPGIVAVYTDESIIDMDCYYCVAYCSSSYQDMCCDLGIANCQQRMVIFSYESNIYNCTWIDQNINQIFTPNISYLINIEGSGLCHPVNNTIVYNMILFGLALTAISILVMFFIIYSIRRVLHLQQLKWEMNQCQTCHGIELYQTPQGYHVAQ